MLKELQDFGLSEKEARVYLASLEIGRATAEKLAKQAKVRRSTTYVQIESLMEKGLMSSFEEDSKRYFAPESPEYLSQILQKEKALFEVKEMELTQSLPDLIRLFENAGDRPSIRFFNGKDGITAMREETLRDLKKGERIYVMYSFEALFALYSKEEVASYSEKREKQGINLKIIYSRKDGKLPITTRGPLSERGFLPSDKFSLETDFFIFGNKVALMALTGNVFGIIIESAAVASSMRKIFDLLWQLTVKE